MIKRWLIRSLFLLPLVCVVAVWVTSYFGRTRVTCCFQERAFEVDSVQGLELLVEVPMPKSDAFVNYAFSPGERARDLGIGPTPLGFCIQDTRLVNHAFLIVFPLWLPTLLLLTLNWLVWRKSRPKVAGRAFPIEPAKSSADAK